MYKVLSNEDSYVLTIKDNHLYLSVLDDQRASASHDSEVIRLTEKELEEFINNLLDQLTELKINR